MHCMAIFLCGRIASVQSPRTCTTQAQSATPGFAERNPGVKK